MRYNVGDIIKYKQNDGMLFIGKIIFNNFENELNFLIKVETYEGEILNITKDKVLQNITEDVEMESNKNKAKAKIEVMRKKINELTVGDIIVPYSEDYEGLLINQFARNGRLDGEILKYMADSIFEVIAETEDEVVYLIKKSKHEETETMIVEKKSCYLRDYFVIAHVEIAPDISNDTRCSNNVNITCSQKRAEEGLREENKKLKENGFRGFHAKYTLSKTNSSKYQEKINDLENMLKEKQEENEKLKKDLAAKQEENEKLECDLNITNTRAEGFEKELAKYKKYKSDYEMLSEVCSKLYDRLHVCARELGLAKKSERHLKICENVLLEKDKEIERLTDQINKIVDSCKNFAPALHEKSNACGIDTTDQFAQFILTILGRN